MQKHEAKIPTKIRPTPASARDAGKVWLGGGGVSLRPVRTAPTDTSDNGKVRLGGGAVSLRPVRTAPTDTSDNGQVRLGGADPSIRPVRTAPANTSDNGQVRLGGAARAFAQSAPLPPILRTTARFGSAEQAEAFVQSRRRPAGDPLACNCSASSAEDDGSVSGRGSWFALAAYLLRAIAPTAAACGGQYDATHRQNGRSIERAVRSRHPDRLVLSIRAWVSIAEMRADRAAAGTMPTRAFRYCEAMTSASAFGWYVFPPITFSLMWDGGSESSGHSKVRTPGFRSERHSFRVSPITSTRSYPPNSGASRHRSWRHSRSPVSCRYGAGCSRGPLRDGACSFARRRTWRAAKAMKTMKGSSRPTIGSGRSLQCPAHSDQRSGRIR